MRSRLRAAFRVLTFVLFGLTAWTLYANVASDDAEVRAKAERTVRDHAGCGEQCRFTGVQGTRGMLAETITYDVAGKGRITVTCARPYVSFGEHECEAATER